MFRIRPAGKDDEEGIRALFSRCFGKQPSHEEWSWKYDAAYLGSSSFVAEADGGIIAHYGGFRLRLYAKGAYHNIWQGCDVMTDPAFRARVFARKGLIVKTAEAFYEANPTEVIFGFPSERHGRLMSLQLGFEKHRFINAMGRPCAEMRPPMRLLTRTVEGWGGISAADVDGLWERTKDYYELTIEKDHRYLFWRYRQCPRGGYQAVAVRNILNARLLGIAVVKEDEGLLRVLEIMPAGRRHLRAVMTAVERIALKRRLDKVRMWVNPSEPLYRELESAGYSMEQDIPCSAKAFPGSGITAARFLDALCYRMGDYDAA
jgi:hypothetical protein